jgi:hypothetical protein
LYALVHHADGLEFLVDPRDLWKPPRIIVRRGYQQTVVWLDETDISFMKPSKFSVRDQQHILKLVREHFDDLLDAWGSLKNDARTDRLERNTLIE